ncbi:hypothetical protein KZZ52_39820 [Dactylosporangium sp. AC04546]|uniref:hypothetical protein n=1 Tax=Dactylosporangium sp. AC04546 TaxID=2862460 RepID=UPI001EDFCEEB|nr:hypothetical protein [Dactylosporangium sp. AC04546]WVK80098.1 hypothetical protein KZZ52_39820 [Dactylosporangium sp. AC04546]
MRTPLKLGAFAAGLAAVFAASLGAGHLAGPVAAPATQPAHGQTDGPAGHQASPQGHTSEETQGQTHGEGGQAHGQSGQSSQTTPGGLQISQDGYTLVPLTTTLTAGTTQEFRFRIDGPDGAPLTRYTVEHEKELHLIAVRRDFAGYQHVHPVRSADGTWSVPLQTAQPGQYRIFADFRPEAADKGLTLGADVAAAGDYQPRPLPASAHTATVDGYTVELRGELHPGTATELGFTISRNGQRIDPEPYLGAQGHLVALRDGDLAYLHVHPVQGTTFAAEVPSAGRYRLYLDFKHGGTVHTAEFTAGTDH